MRFARTVYRSSPPTLVLETLPNGEHAWLRPRHDEPRFWLTDLGYRHLALEALFGPLAVPETQPVAHLPWTGGA